MFRTLGAVPKAIGTWIDQVIDQAGAMVDSILLDYRRLVVVVVVNLVVWTTGFAVGHYSGQSSTAHANAQASFTLSPHYTALMPQDPDR